MRKRHHSFRQEKLVEAYLGGGREVEVSGGWRGGNGGEPEKVVSCERRPGTREKARRLLGKGKLPSWGRWAVILDKTHASR